MKEISSEEFKRILADESRNTDVDFINVCTPVEYQEKHIEGVRNVPLDELQNHLSEFTNKKTIYVHCQSGNRARKAIQKLEELGVQAEFVNLAGGLIGWSNARFPTESPRTCIPLARQLMIALGFLTVTGVLLALYIHPAFVFLSLFVGIGQISAGITGWCGLSLLLERMPWNKVH